MAPIPLMFLSDSPMGATGLGRITRELATRVAQYMPETFRVATAGYGGITSRHLPFEQYAITRLDNWVVPELPQIWRDFAGNERGVLMTVWNAGWLPWLAMPETYLPESELKKFLLSDPFDKWGYWPIDAEGPGGKLHPQVCDVIRSFDRSLAYTAWGASVINRSCWPGGEVKTENLPHGTDTSVFFPRDRKEARSAFLGTGGQVVKVEDDTFLVGIVATNTARKDWALGLETCWTLANRGMKVGVWAHTDSVRKNWDLVALADAFGFQDRIIITNDHRSDEQMALSYAACNVTLGIGSGEGWGYPLTESLACGIPVIHGHSAGGSEIVPAWMKVEPRAYRCEGFYANMRPVFRAKDWADKIKQVLSVDESYVMHRWYSWNDCWPKWEHWLKEGVNG